MIKLRKKIEGAAPEQTKEESEAVGELSFFGGYGAEPICAAWIPFHKLIPFVCFISPALP